MRVQRLVALVLVVFFFLCTYDRDGPVAAGTALLARGNEDDIEYDIIQRTCALEVVLVVRDRDDLRAHDGIHDNAPMHLNAEPAGIMLACMPPRAE